MQMFVVTVEVASTRRLDPDKVRRHLGWFRPWVRGTSPGQQAVTLTIPAASPQQSAASGLRIVHGAFKAPVLSCNAVAEQ